MEQKLIKKRFVEEINTCGLKTIEIARRINVSPEMITQYKTTKKCLNLILLLNYAENLI